MNRYISIIVVLFVSVVISFCTKDYDVESLLVETPVEFTSSGIAPSRVTINDEWEQGDEVGIYMMESESGVTLEQNIRYGVNSGEGTSFATFSPLDGGAITYPGSGVIVDFLCYYPYTRSDVDGTVVIANAGTDLLISQVSGKGSGEVVNFGFDHVMSKVAIVVTANDDLADLGGLGDLDVIINNVCSYSQYDMLNDTFTAVDDAATTSLTFDVVLDGNNSATVSTILIPGSYDNVIEFSVGERSYYANFTATLASGECGNFTAVLGNDNVVFDIDNIVDWASGASGDVGTSLLFDNWIDVAAEQFDFGDGSQSNPWLVSNGYQLAKLAADLQSGVNDYEGEYILLTDDIDLLGAEWSAIGGEKSPFKGTFLGKNYYISGMTITNSTGGAGLFGYLSGATIENVGIVDCNISINYANVGGLVGYASNSTSISSCFVTGTIGGGSLNVGGLVGYGEDLFITESFSSVELSGNNQSFYVGGLVGYSKGGLIFHSNNLGSVKGCSYVGGIVGCCDGSKIVTCYNSGEVGVADFAQGSVGFGGVAGEVKSGTIFASYNTADVDLLSTATVVGGVIGSLEGDNIVTSCYNSGVVSGSGLFGGVYSDQIACYYVGVDGDEGSAVESIAALNDELIIDQMNNQIELWNLYNETQVLYYYVAGADDDTPPSFAGGVTDVSDVEDWSTMAAPRFASGSGTDSDPYIISNGYELARLAVDVQDGQSYDGKYFNLSDDIDLMGGEWIKIGSQTCHFKGNFDGNNRGISDFKITSDEGYIGLFGYVSGASIHDLSVSGFDISGSTSVGALVGQASNNSTITNCHVDGTVYGSSDLVGGLVGYLVDSVVEECSSAGGVTGNGDGYYYVGGLVGYACDSDDVDDTEVVNSFNIASVDGGTYTGGVLGGATDSDSYSHYRGVTIYGCYNSGTITSTSTHTSYAGGVAGRFYDSQMVACYNIGEVNATGYGGGLIGCVHVNATTTRISNFFGCYNLGTVTGTTSSDALFGRSDISGVNMVQDCYYVDGSQTGGYGEICTDISSKVDYLNNAIAYWNYNCARKYYYVYGSGSVPALSAGTPIFHFDNWSNVVSLAYAGGSGTESDPYQISDGYQLAKLAGDVADGESYGGKYFVITKEIDLESIEWTPIGGVSHAFQGYFDGGSLSITNLKISGSSSYMGLFGCLSGATIESVTISGSDLSGGGFVGTLAGQAVANTTITDCHVDGIKVYGSGDLVGGMVGSLSDSVVDECSSAGTVTGNSGGSYYVGGLVGYASDSDDVDDTEVVNSSNAASVVDGTYTGGVLGGATDSDQYNHFRGVTIYGCHNSGTITSASTHTSYAGGVAGRFYDSQMLACYNSGEINATGYAGGLIGCVHVNATTSRMSNFFGCYSVGSATGTTSSDALFSRSDISGVNTVLDCYYVGGSQTNGYGESCADISALNDKIDYLNNAIAYWNQNILRQYEYIYVEGADGPTLTEGSGDMYFDSWSDVPALIFDGGSGDEGDPYLINDGYQLAKLSKDVKDGETYEGKYFRITDNIDLEGKLWSPIGRDGYIFYGTVDGGSHTISNLTIEESGGSVGLFGYINESSIFDLTVSGYDVSGSICVGALVGRADLSYINNCHVAGVESTLSATSDYVGGLIGYNVDSSVANCSSEGIISGPSYVGGLIGYAYQRTGDDDIEIFNCHNSATVKSGTYVGGLLGGAADDDVETYKRGISIYCSHNSGEITIGDSGVRYAGGIAGRFHDGQMVGCYNWGSVTNSSGYAGGLIGCVHVNVSTKTSGFYGCYNSGVISGSTSSEALFGTTTSLEMVKDCYYLSPATDSDSSGLGVAASSLSELNSDESLSYLNNGIATWNVISVRDINYIYTSGSDGPTLISGTPEVIADYWVDIAAAAYGGGSGTSGSPYQIANVEQLAKLSKDVAGGTTYEGVYFEITDDINLMGKQWSSIGSSSHIFKGCVDGGNHTISNITVYTSESHQGLFGYISGAILENINVDGYLYGAGSLGGVVGYARGNSTIRNCHADVNVYGSGDLVGGLAGSISDSVVEGCSSAGKVTCTSTGNYYYGGLIGYASDSDDIDDTEVINCSNSATVVDGTYTGGILGGATDSDQYSHYRGVSIFGCYNTGAITTSKSAAYAGGVAGRFYDSQMLACYNTGEVTSGDHAGGLIGCVHINATTTRMSNFFGCYNTGTISGTISSDALFGYSSISGVNMVMNCYYTSGTQTNDYGEICSDINAQVDLMNNAIAYWNINSGRVYSYIYVTGTTPTLAAGTAELDFDEWSDMAWIAFDGGSGTEGDPYQIANGCQLAKLSNDVAGGESYDGIYFEITDNIDLLSNEWTPIGGSSCQFKGSLDGNSHTISNLKISGSNSRVGLFGYIYGATVSNLTISGGDISGGQYVGGVVGEANEGSTVSHCSVSVTVNSTGDFTGGLVGYLTESVVDYCSAAGTVTGDGDSWYYIGGLIGYACDSDDVADTEVVNSYNTASVNGGTYTGGVLGGAADTDSYDHYRGVSIYGCYNSGTITSSSSHTSYAGGVVGRFYNGQMVACYNNGAVNATGYAGGLNGCVHVNATTSRMSNFFGCYNTGVISGTISSDALFGHSDVSGVSGVLNCYYTSGTQTNGYGESCTDLAVKVAYLNNAIAYWNYNSVRQYGYIYSYSSAPTLVEGVAVFNFDDWSDVAALEFDGGSGTSGDPYQINDGYQLAKLSSDVEGGESYDGIYFEITDNIDLQSKSWSSIGRDGYIFKGIVDGGNNTISNMKVVEVPNPLTAGGGSVGLFGYVEGSTIANITLSGYSVDGTICVGGLLGRADLSFVNNCHVDGALSSTSNYGGGVIGYLVDTSVANCSSAGTVSGASYVGGLVGYAYQRSGVDDIEIFNCSNSATVSDGTYIGGLLGGAADDDVETYTRGIAIYCSYNSGDVITSGSGSKYAGGIAGRFHDGQMVGCYNWGGVTNTCSTGYAGGLIGCVHINSTTKTSGFYGCYSSGAISGTTSSEALFGVTHSLEAVMDCYYTSQTDSSGNGVSVSSITELNENIAYLNNAIAFWNLNSVRYLGYVYTSGSNGPTITTGTPAVYDSNWYYAAASSYAGGSGTESSPYQISNGYQLAKMAVDYESVSPSSSTYFELTNDIDLTLFEWTPIRQGSENLNHIYFDGNNYKISGLTINSDSDHLSLFGRLSYSELQNIRLVDCNITSTSNYIGGLVGALSESLIYNCSVESGTISGSENVGGVVGNVNSCNAIEHCYNSGASVLGSSIVGGVIGYLCYSGSVYACYNEGYVASDSSSSGSDFGGVIGKAYQNDNFIACYNNGAIYAPNSSIIGGVVGYVQGYSSNYTDITSCYNSGVITGKSTTGSIAGSSSYYVSWYCSYYLAGDYYSSSHGVSCSDYSELNGYVSTMNNNITSGSYQTEYEYVAGADPTTQPPTLVEK